MGVSVGTAALVIVLSVFNGFENLVLSLYNSFDPPIKITSSEGKVFNPEEVKNFLDKKNIIYSQVLEEKVLLKYKNKEYIATLKGVDDNFKNINSLDSMIVSGRYFNESKSANSAIIGQGVAYYLSMNIGDMLNPLQVFLPNREKRHLLNPETAFTQLRLNPVGMFAIQADFDAKYVITSLDFMQKIASRDMEVSAIEVLCNSSEMKELQSELIDFFGSQYNIQNRHQQHAFLYKMLNSEKLAVFLILTFILIIASFNMVGSLSMLIIDKKQDVKTLSIIGASKKSIQRIFLYEGFLNTFFGALIGIVFGLSLCFLQLKFGFLRMGDGSFVVNYYPVEIDFIDIAIILITVLSIGILASAIPVWQLRKNLN